MPWKWFIYRYVVIGNPEKVLKDTKSTFLSFSVWSNFCQSLLIFKGHPHHLCTSSLSDVTFNNELQQQHSMKYYWQSLMRPFHCTNIDWQQIAEAPHQMSRDKRRHKLNANNVKRRYSNKSWCKYLSFILHRVMLYGDK